MSETIEKGTQITHEGASYTIGDELGSGLFGVVYLAQCADGTSVAIKKTKKTLVDPLTNDQFQNEIFCLKFISHPAIPKWIANFQSESGYGYLVMEYVEGQDLNEYAESHSITEQEALKITKSVADALQKLADRNPSILHYDIKPNNIRVSPIGSPYLLDFGSVGVDEKRNPTTESIYSPPEQVNHEQVDERGVLYALGATLFDLLTNQDPPDSGTRITYRDSNDIYALLIDGGVSGNLAALVARMMHPNKAQRYQSFAKLQVAIDKVSRRRFVKLQAVIDKVIRRIVTPRPPTSKTTNVPRNIAPTLPLREIPLPPSSKRPRPWVPFAGLGMAATLVVVGLFMLFRAIFGPGVVPIITIVSTPTSASAQPGTGSRDATSTSTQMPTVEPPTVTAMPTVETPTVTATPTVEPPTVTATPTVELPTVTAIPTVKQTTVTAIPTVEPPTAEPPTVEWPTAEWPTAEPPTVEWPTAEWPTAEPPTATESPKSEPTQVPNPTPTKPSGPSD